MSNFDFRSSTRPLNETAPAAASSISGYGPLLLYQQVDKALIFRRRQKGEGNFSYDWPGNADLDAMIGTQLALVPISANHTKIHWEDAVGMLYQDKNGKLVALNYNLLRGVYEVPKSWPFSKLTPLAYLCTIPRTQLYTQHSQISKYHARVLLLPSLLGDPEMKTAS